MKKNKNTDERIRTGNGYLHVREGNIQGDYVDLFGEPFYRIRNYDQMPPFFMSIVSSSNQWLFISSTGGLTAGRVNPDSSLFPYIGDEDIARNSGSTGAITVFRVQQGNTTYVWEPFSQPYAYSYVLERNIYKNVYGNVIVFEEINVDLGLSYRYAWRMSDKYGFVKTSWLKNISPSVTTLNLIDGLQNILPYGAGCGAGNPVVDAHKYNELEPRTGLGLFSLTASPGNKTEVPREALKATVVWQTGIDTPVHLISSHQLDNFRRGQDIVEEQLFRGHTGAYLLYTSLALTAGEEKRWSIVADVNQDHVQIASRINTLLREPAKQPEELERDIAEGNRALAVMMAQADGLQLSADTLGCSHHFSNVLFNTMRGGIYADQYFIDKADLVDFVLVKNRPAYKNQQPFFYDLPDKIDVEELRRRATSSGSPDIERLCREYLPLTFSRRHGDPSRPWNLFSINIRKADGTKRLYFEGNWRDLFQNWEALSWSFPGFTGNLIIRFLNTTTADGYNPYQLTRDTMPWIKDTSEEKNRLFGYWNDHQIVYLEKLMDIEERIYPGRLADLLQRRIFCHADIPYRIREYSAIVQNGFKTIDYDHDRDKEINKHLEEIGTDGVLMLTSQKQLFYVSLLEKLLLLLLAKLSNLVPEGGLWMNTQKPEWNDANNALAGKGLSVVTLCQVRRYIAFIRKLVVSHSAMQYPLTQEVLQWFGSVRSVLILNTPLCKTGFDDKARRRMTDALGQASSDYRLTIYRNGFSGTFSDLDKNAIVAFLDLAQEHCEYTLRANKRSDHLYHSYNVLHFGSDTLSISHLDEMLEGQAAILSSGMLNGEESLKLLKALRGGRLYRPDQHSYLLSPDKILPGFLARNSISSEQASSSRLIAKLVENKDVSLILQDENRLYHFNGDFKNAFDVKNALMHLKQNTFYAELVDREADFILQLFESLFVHSKYLGRSGVMFAYEGLGSIYWHMVSKLLLAAQETSLRALTTSEAGETTRALIDCYYDIRKGLGFNKSPDIHGAFPTDPYSYTPGGQGAKQPGMTGQVKEEILTRLKEMGVFVEGGVISFNPILLKTSEFLEESRVFHYYDVQSREREMTLTIGALAFTFCQVPVVYRQSLEDKIDISLSNGTTMSMTGHFLNPELSRHIFDRDGVVCLVTVYTSAQCVKN